MRAPDTINVDIDDVRWQQIRDVCRRNGVDADKIMVRKTPLRTELERLAARYIKHKDFKSPTERQNNEIIDEGLAEIATFRDHYILKRAADGHEYRNMVAFFASHGVIKQLLQALDELEAELRASLVPDAPAVKDNAAERARDHYWFQLRRLWTKIAPHTRKRKPLADFLQAATGASTSQIKNFLDRLPRKASRIADYPGYL